MSLSLRRVDFDEGYKAWLRAPFTAGEGRLVTLSEGGAYVATRLHLLPQSQLGVAIEVPELRRTLQVEAVVAWENRGERRPSRQPEGYGLRFLRVPHASAEAIRWLLQRVERQAEERESARAGERAREEHEVVPTRALSPDEIEAAMERARASSTSERREGRPSPAARASHVFPGSEAPPYRLEANNVVARVPPSTAGVFILAYDRTLDAFVGRADTDLRKSLTEFIGEYSFFHIEPVPARKERFERECELYHRLGGDRGQLDNREHPLPPAGPQLKCPVCVKERLG